jgi:hypothetical protein
MPTQDFTMFGAVAAPSWRPSMAMIAGVTYWLCNAILNTSN